MRREKKLRTLEDELVLLSKEIKQSSLSVDEIINILSGKGRYVLLVLFSIPFCQPLQIPGLSLPLGLLIAFLGLRAAFWRHVWLPKKLVAKHLSQNTVEKIVTKTLALVRSMKRWVHPRLLWWCRSLHVEVLSGCLIAALGILLALPLPIPFTNLIVAWPIFLISLGMLEDDGIFILLGYMLTIFAIGFFVILFFLGEKFLGY